MVVAAGTHTKPSHLATFNKVQNPLHLPGKTASEVSKVVRACGAFDVFEHLDFQMCSAPQQLALIRHVNFQNVPKPVCLVPLDLEISFVPQRLALFRRHDFQKRYESEGACSVHLQTCFAPQKCTLSHLNFKKWSENGVFCTV